MGGSGKSDKGSLPKACAIGTAGTRQGPPESNLAVGMPTALHYGNYSPLSNVRTRFRRASGPESNGRNRISN